jgi:hypothetical protein
LIQIYHDQENIVKQTNRAALPVRAKVAVDKNGREGPPKTPRSAFTCFGDAKKKEIVARHGIAKVKL